MERGTPRVGLMLALEPDFVAAVLPLFERDEVGALSLPVDFSWMRAPLPEWAADLVRHFERTGALSGHAIHYSTLSSVPSPANVAWLDAFVRSGARTGLRSLSAHFGVSVVRGYVRGAPLPVPFGAEALRCGRAWMSHLATAAGCPVGLENLALAFSAEDVREQGPFIAELLTEVDGFVTLDVHNVLCQAKNFDLDAYEILSSYPLDRVREVHVSGGSVGRSSAEPGRLIRQDTHDGDVPDEAFALAEWVVARAPAIEAVLLERLGGTIATETAAEGLRRDYRRLALAVERGVEARASASTRSSNTPASRPAHSVDDSGALADYETTLVRVLSSRAPALTLAPRLAEEAPAAYRVRVGRSAACMLDLGAAVVREWFEEAAT